MDPAIVAMGRGHTIPLDSGGPAGYSMGPPPMGLPPGMPPGAPAMWPPRPPPPLAPPPAPGAALLADAARAARDASSTIESTLAAVSLRVAPMLANATRASESQVSAEIRRLEASFQALNAKVSRVEALLRLHEPASRSVNQDNLLKMLLDVEQRWEQEIKTVKRELHQTILAHNHNADLMADHKTAIDKIKANLDEQGPPERVQSDQQFQDQLNRLAQTLQRNQSQDQEVDAILRRGDMLLQRFGAMASQHSLPTGVPHMSMPPYGPGPGYQHGYSGLTL